MRGNPRCSVWSAAALVGAILVGAPAGSAAAAAEDFALPSASDAAVVTRDTAAGGTVAPLRGSELAVSRAWEVESDQDEAHLGLAVAPAGDVNGDGYDDVIIGAPFYDGGQRDEGRAYVFLGGPEGLQMPAAWSAESDQEHAHLGYAVASAGDVDGDGFADVLVGIPHLDAGGEDEGGVWLFLGSPAGPERYPSWRFAGDQSEAFLGASAAGAGDVNGDGYGDVVVGAPGAGDAGEGRALLFLGSPSGLAGSPRWTATGQREHAHLGHSVAAAGDVDGDGFADVVVGAPHCSARGSRAGRALVFRGGPAGLSGGPEWVCDGEQPAAMFGVSVAGAGDVNGDGYADIVVGSSSFTGRERNEGRAFIFLGSRDGPGETPLWCAGGDRQPTHFGCSVAGAGDVNGDGFDDVVVGARDFSASAAGSGRASVFHGSVQGIAARPAWSAEGDHEDGHLGWSVAAAGDVNRDGYADIVVGAPFVDGRGVDNGRACVLYGTPDALSAAAPWTAAGGQPEAEMGRSVAFAGDVNGDGYDDVIVGAPGFDAGGVDAGRAFVFHGSEGGLDPVAAWHADGAHEGARLGAAVASAGDVNSDGYADVIVGAPGASAGARAGGQALVYLGSSEGLAAGAAWTVAGSQEAAHLGAAVTAADLDGDGFSDVVVGVPDFDGAYGGEGVVLAFAGAAAGLAERPTWTASGGRAGAHFGSAVASAGDLDGNACDDLVVGAPGAGSTHRGEGRVVTFLGSATGPGAEPAWVAEGGAEDAHLGASVAGAGDTDGDGHADLVAALQRSPAERGRDGEVLAFRGAQGGLESAPAWAVAGGRVGVGLGTIVAGGGDLDGDGVADVAVGAPFVCERHGEIGRVAVYGGSRAGPSGQAAWIATSDQAGDLFGGAIGGGGDVNGDGYGDLMVGAPGFDGRFADEGRAYLFNGSAEGLAGTGATGRVRGAVSAQRQGAAAARERHEAQTGP